VGKNDCRPADESELDGLPETAESVHQQVDEVIQVIGA
jgi:hypothetical protein